MMICLNKYVSGYLNMVCVEYKNNVGQVDTNLEKLF